MSMLTFIPCRDINGSDYKLKSNASDSAKNLMRPKQLVCLNNLSYDINFSGESVQEVDRIVSDPRFGEVTISIFGWNVAIEGGDPSKAAEATHVAKWDKQSGTMTVLPQMYGFSINVAAIVGEKLSG